jgi:hypothetical protein
LGCSDSISSPRTGVEAILTELGPENQNRRYAASSHRSEKPEPGCCPIQQYEQAQVGCHFTLRLAAIRAASRIVVDPPTTGQVASRQRLDRPVVVTCTPSAGCAPPADHWATGRRHGASAKRKSPSSSRKDALDLSTGSALSVGAPMAAAGEAAMQAVGGVSRPGRPRLGGELREAQQLLSRGKGAETKWL